MDDSHQTLRRVGIAGLGLTGAASGLLSVSLLKWLTSTLSRQGFPITLLIPGTVFVVMISAYRLIFMRLRFTPKLLGILAASIAAYVVALYTTMYAIDPNSPLRSIGSRKISFDGALFVGGAVGAFILVAAAMLLFSTQSKWVAALRKALMWSLLGGTLAVVGWELGSSLGKGLWLLLHSLRVTLSDADIKSAITNETVHLCSLFVVWQAGMATLLGLLISQRSTAARKGQSAASV